MPSHQPLRLPPLPFGERLALRESNAQAYGDLLAKFNPSLGGYEPVGNRSEFNSKMAATEINGVKLVSGANTPIYIESGNASDINLLLPFQGSVAMHVEGKHFRFGVDQGAMLLPATGRRGKSTLGGSTIMTIVPDRIQAVAQAMLGVDPSEFVDLRLEEPRLLPLQLNHAHFTQIFRQLSNLMDECLCRPETLTHLGLDDVFYRVAVQMLRPDLFLAIQDHGRNKKETSTPAGHRPLDCTLAYIDSRLNDRITLTDLERESNVSSRQLQHLFQSKLGCSPMAWILERRLHLAHQRILQAGADDSVTNIAVDCGFTNLGRFSMCYRAKFGETPSETLRRSVR